MSNSKTEKFLESMKSFKGFEIIDFIMPGFPLEGFLKAWFEPFSGYDLNWIELEILFGSFKFISIKALRENIIKTFPEERNKHFTTFYRKIKQMANRKLLEEEKDGKDTIVKISNSGAIELGKYFRYNMFKTFSFSQSSWHVQLVKIITDQIGCIHTKTMIGVFSSIIVYADLLKYCNKYDKDTILHKINKEKIFLVFPNKNQNSKSENETIQTINLDDYNLFLKDEFVDLFIANNLLANLEKPIVPLFLNELKRVMKKGSILFFSEIKEDLMNPMVENMAFFARIMEFSKTMQAWDMKIANFTTKEIVELLESNFNEVKVQTYGFTNLYSAKK